ncbi:MAG: 2OG-Fe(II) oxygenase [Gammaproteobacteria bacterium]|nr:2OG-Fe(II) oxygenase [Gammaproteobacteria bacterium]
MDSEQVSFTNPKWQPLIDAIVSEIQQKLGLETRQLVANLYKLLVYEKGSFFLSHRDGEKLDGMVATLVVSLPSIHTDGELVVSHNGHRHVCDFPGAASGNELSFAAFYADCEHEVQPLASGYRLCLTYNLRLAKSRRRHLHDMIDRHGCDLTHVTERRGRPFTLVCTKTIASYERALAVYHRNVDNLARIVDIEKRMVK